MVVPFGLLAMGVLLAYSGLKGKTVIETLRGLPGTVGNQPYQADVRAAQGSEAGVGEKSTSDSTAAPQQQRGSGISAGRVRGYANPTPSRYWSVGRTDQGVDFAPKQNGAPILAIGDGKVIKTGAPGWPGGGGGVLYQLTAGSRRGQYVFVYESVNPTVHAGQTIKAGQVIAHGHTGGTGIEMGFADRNGVPLAHAGYTEGKVTQWGTKFKQFWESLTHTPQHTGSSRAPNAPHHRANQEQGSSRTI